MNKLTKKDIDDLMSEVVVHTTTSSVPTPHVTAFAWLGTFQLGTAISKAVDPANFNEEILQKKIDAGLMVDFGGKYIHKSTYDIIMKNCLKLANK